MNQISVAWEKDDELEEQIKQLYHITPSGSRLIDRAMKFWVRT